MISLVTSSVTCLHFGALFPESAKATCITRLLGSKTTLWCVRLPSSETPLSMDQFQCAVDNVESNELYWGGLFPPGYLGAVLVRSQQGQLATDHYGLSSSGEPRRPLSDCDVDLAEQPPPSQRTRRGSVPAFIP